jgi:putative protease
LKLNPHVDILPFLQSYQDGRWIMPEEEIGTIVKFFAKPSVAALEVTKGTIQIGDTLRYKGHTTDFTETVTSMEVDNQSVEEAKAGDMVGIKVKDRVRENDKVYKVLE